MTKAAAPEPIKAYATLRVAGDLLVPEQVTRILKVVPRAAYMKDEHYSGGSRSPDLVGRTGVWHFTTDGAVAGNRLQDHLAFLIRLLTPVSGDAGPLLPLQQLLRRKSLRMVVTCFWHGPAGARRPSIPRSVTETLKSIPAEIETDFDLDQQSDRHAA
jgi:hypothetical protein